MNPGTQGYRIAWNGAWFLSIVVFVAVFVLVITVGLLLLGLWLNLLVELWVGLWVVLFRKETSNPFPLRSSLFSTMDQTHSTQSNFKQDQG